MPFCRKVRGGRDGTKARDEETQVHGETLALKTKYSSAALTGLKSYAEAVNAKVEAYTANSYQCPWSQRSPQFMFREFGLKQYYDAANTGCCDEQIRPFSAKPQYAEESAPMTPKECYRDVTLIGCSNLEAPHKTVDGCASQNIETQFNVICPKLCEQFRDLDGGTISGKYGRFELVGKETEEDWLIRYRVNSSEREEAFNTCAGEVTLRERYCEYGVVETRIKASLADPQGCYCDCCGLNGRFAGPTHEWVNTAIPSSSSAGVSVNPILSTACKDGQISSGYGTWNDGLGSMAFSWVTDSAYVSDGISHYVERLGGIGDRDHPACCGFNYVLSGSDGCGWSGIYSGSVGRKAAAPVLSPSSGEWISGGYRSVYLSGCCFDSNKLGISVSRSCLQDSNESVSRVGDQLQWEALVQLINTRTCKGCCGNGTLSVSYNDGCNKTGSGSINVRNTVDSGVIGHVYRCALSDSKWVYQRVDLHCAGGLSSIWTDAGGNYGTLADCDTYLRQNAANNAKYQTGCNGKGCLYLTENGYTGTARRVAAICVKDDQCCKISGYSVNGEWILNGGDCCNKDGSIA